MPRGGARVRSGPAKDPNAIRRSRPSDRPGFVYLPAAGRPGDPPAWPLQGKVSAWERERWKVEWAKPQAVAWERLGLDVQVALYVQALRRASAPNATLGILDKVMSLMDRLGLTQDGLAKNGWQIADVATPAPAPRRPTSSSAKDRLKVIGGTDARAS